MSEANLYMPKQVLHKIKARLFPSKNINEYERKKTFKNFRRNLPKYSLHKKRILLIRPPFLGLDTGPPIGLAYIQGMLKKEGHQVLLWDMNLELTGLSEGDINRDFVIPATHPAVQPAYTKLDEYCRDILYTRPDIIGFSLAHSTVKYGIEMAKRLSKHVRCIAGGPQASFNETDLLSVGCFDTIVSGYGEEAVLEALHTKGIISKPLISSKEYLPDYTGVTIDKYGGFLPIVTTRGCPNRCSFCTQQFSYFYHSIESVAKQIKETPHIQKVMFNDSNININTKRTEELFSKLSQLAYKPESIVLGMAIKKSFRNYVAKMAEANVKEVFIGLESGSLRERRSMNKPEWSNDLAVEFIKELTLYHIKVLAQFIFCYPDQTENDRKQTVELMKHLNHECHPNLVRFNWYKFVVHLGREEFFRKKYGVITHSPQNWENNLYNPERILQLWEKYSSLVPKNTRILI